MSQWLCIWWVSVSASVSLTQSLHLFRHWTCLGVSSQLASPQAFRIGDLPLVVWKSPQDGSTAHSLHAALNICKHMGSRLDPGTVTDHGCLKCPYHGYEYAPTSTDTFGTVVEQEGKLFWALDPVERAPPKLPYYYHRDYVTSTLVVDMDASLRDSALNTVDIRHPEYVHRMGFGSALPPQNIRNYRYKDGASIGVAFDYRSNTIMQQLNQHRTTTRNFHLFQYPSFTWSRVSFADRHLLIGVHFLPLGPQKTRWFVTLCHNYHTSPPGILFMQGLAKTILQQDAVQMQRQAADSALKSQLLFDHVFADETAVTDLHHMFEEYRYPDEAECLRLYKWHKESSSSQSGDVVDGSGFDDTPEEMDIIRFQ